MKRITRILGVFLCLVMVFSGSAFAAGNAIIDVTTSPEGYFTVDYNNYIGVKMKVGVTYDGATKYYNYTPGEEASYTFSEGDGTYTIALYRNVGGTKYRQITKTTAQVELVDVMAPYLASTAEITFSEEDAVGLTAAALCEGLETNEEKIVAIYNYISEYFKYDYKFAAQVRSGAVKNYTPDTNLALETEKGVCYDFSALFAAMCRSEEIPCAVAKGYLGGAYHAWNMVWLDEEWIAVDMTAAVCKKHVAADELSDCVVDLARYTDYTF